MQLALKETRLGLRNSTVRIPFRYGAACLTRCPQAIASVTIEAGGKVHRGYSGDCLPPSWFDKSPGKDYAAQITDMLAVIRLAEKRFLETFARPTKFFPAWLATYQGVHAECVRGGFTPLLASFGISLVERALLDALARVAGRSFSQAVRTDLYGIVPGEVHPRLAGLEPADWLPPEPERQVWVRHTVGLGDPLTTADIPAEERLHDGLPQSLEEYVGRTGIRYFKIKVSNRLEQDLERLHTIAALVEKKRHADYRVTLDGNEQYKQAADFDRLIDAIEAAPKLRTLWQNTLVVEQPLERGIALDEAHTSGIRQLSHRKPVIIDESDGTLDAYPRAVELGYRGVSSKNCKGPVKSLLNAGLIWLLNDRGAHNRQVMTGEDLCTVGVVPVQSDLCLTATLGLTHVERNGHHFHPGLTYLPEAERRSALQAHPDFYIEQNGLICPRLADGRFEIGSLQCAGFGFAVEPDMDAMPSADKWTFASLGLPPG